MSKGKIALASLSIALLIALVEASAAAPVRTPGVSVGDWFTYGNASFYWYSNDSSVIPPSDWEDMNETKWFRNKVEDVVDTNITGSFLLHYKNDTETTEDGWVDIDTGDNENMGLFFISANLAPGDPIYTTGTYQTWTIDETIPVTYPGGERDTNHLNITMEMSVPPIYINMSVNIYWDKATGVLTEMSMMFLNQTMTYRTEYSLSLEMTGSSRWIVPEFFGLPQMLLLLALLTLVTVASKRKSPETQNETQSSYKA